MSARFVFGLFVAVLIGGCNKLPEGPAPQSEEEFTDERIRLLQDLGDLLTKITDERSAKDNLTHVQDQCRKLRENKTQADKARKAREKEKNPPKPPSEFAKKRQQTAMTDATKHVIEEFKRMKTIAPTLAVREEVQIVLNAGGIFP